MKIIQKGLKLDSADYYNTHLKIVNTFLPTKMSNSEIRVLSTFMTNLDKFTYNELFTTPVRKKVMTKLNLAPGGLGNFLKQLFSKGILSRDIDTKRVMMKDFLKPDNKLQGYRFKIYNNDYRK